MRHFLGLTKKGKGRFRRKMGEILSPKLLPQVFRLGCGCIGIYELAGAKGRQPEREQLGYLKGLHSRERFEAGPAGF